MRQRYFIVGSPGGWSIVPPEREIVDWCAPISTSALTPCRNGDCAKGPPSYAYVADVSLPAPVLLPGLFRADRRPRGMRSPPRSGGDARAGAWRHPARGVR